MATNYLTLRSSAAPTVNAVSLTYSTLTGSTMRSNAITASTLTLTSTAIGLGVSTNQTYASLSNGSYTSGWGSTLTSLTSTTKISMNQNGNILLVTKANSSTINTSNDSGVTWTALTGANSLPAGATAFPVSTASGTPNYTSISQSATGQYILASVNGGLLYTSANAGASFTPAGLGSPNIYLPLDGSTADATGSSTVTVTGAVSYTTGSITGTRAAVISNTAGGTANNYIRGTWSGASNYTITGWFNLQSYSASNPIVLFSAHSGNTVVYINPSTNRLGANFISTSTVSVTTSFAISLNTWYYVTYIFQSNGLCYLYVNNVLIGTVASSGGLNSQVTMNFSIGTYDVTNTYAFNGYVDEFRIYNSLPPMSFFPPQIYLPFEGSASDAMGNSTMSSAGTITYLSGSGAVGSQAALFINTVGGSASNYLRYTWSGGTSFAFSGWMNPQSLAGHQNFLAAYSGGFVIYITPSSTLGLYANSSTGGVTIATSYTLTKNTWYSFFASFQSNGTGYFYVNNVLVGTYTCAATAGTSSGYIGIGTNDNVQSVPFNGYIDDVRIYNSAVTFSPIIPMNWTQTAVSSTGQYMLAAATTGGLFQSSNYGATWTQVQSSVGAWTGLSMSATGQYQLALSGGYTIPNLSGLTTNTWSMNGVSWTASANANSSTAYYAFNNNYTSGNNWLGQLSPSGQYNSSGAYIGSASTTILGGIGAIAGEWVQLQSSVPLVLQSYSYAVGTYNAQPKTMYIVGSTDGTNWYPLQLHVLASNPFTAMFTAATNYIIMNQTGTQTVAAGATASLTTTAYPYTTQAFTYFRFIMNSNFLTVQDCGQFGEIYPVFLTGESYSTNYGAAWTPLATYGSDAFNIVKSAALTTALSSFITMPAFRPVATGVTFSCWFNLTATPASYARIFDMSPTTAKAGDTDAIIMMFDPSQKIICRTYVGSTLSYTATTTSAFSNNTLYHVVWTIDMSGNWIIYINGTSNVVYNPSILNIQTYNYFFLGKSNYTGNPFTNININDFRMYNRAISATEVTALYAANHGAAINPTPTLTGLTASTWTTNGITWTVDKSSQYDVYSPNRAFNNTSSSTWASAVSSYNTSTGAYQAGTASTTVLGGVGAVAGEYLQLQSSVPVIMFNYTLSGGGPASQSPKIYYIVGSTDATNWYPIQYVVMGSNPFTSNYSTATTYITVNQAGSQTLTANVSATLTCTTYPTTNNAYTYFRFITTYNWLGNLVEINEWYINFAYPSAATLAYSFSAVSGNGQYALMGYGQSAWLTNNLTNLSAGAGTLQSLPGINASIMCASISGTGQYMVIMTQGTSNNVYYTTNYGVIWTALTVGSVAMTSCAISYDGSYITVSNATTVYTLNLNATGYTVAVGNGAGAVNQGQNAIAIGNQAGLLNQTASSIVMNATGAALNAYQPGLFVAPVSAISNTAVSNVTLLGYGTDSQITQVSGVYGTVNGYVGIGTTSPLGMLQVGHAVTAAGTSNGTIVVGSNYGTQFRYFKMGYDSNYNFVMGDYGYPGALSWANQLTIAYGAPSNSLYINSSGNVGIGTASPATTLHVYGTTTNAHIIENTASSGYASMYFKNNTPINAYMGVGGSAVGGNFQGNFFIQSPTSIIFNTGGNSTSGTVGMFINSSGNVGIGTSSPTASLFIKSTADYGNSLVVNTAWPSIRLGQSSSTGRDWCILNGATGADIGQGNFGIFDITGSAYRFCINSSGYVGIGANTPMYKTQIVLASNSDPGTANVFGLTTANSSTESQRLYMGLVDNGGSGTNSYSWISASRFGYSYNVLALQPVSGYVGIGITNPSAQLQLSGSSMNRLNGLYVGPSSQSGIVLDSTSAASGRSFNIWSTNASDSTGVGCLAFFDVTGSAYRMVINPSGYVGIGTQTPGYILDVNGTSRFAATIMTSTINIAGAQVINFGYDQTKESNAGKIGYGTFSTGGSLDIVGAGTSTRSIRMWDNVIILGSISKGSGTFDIEHPLQSDKRLVHSFIEGPRCDLIYRGKTRLINGVATVDINKECTQRPECAMDDGTFEALCANPQTFLQNNQTFDRVIGSISGATLTITCENSTSNAMIEWMVIAERIDPFIKKWERTDSNGYLITQYTAENTSVEPSV